MNPKIMSFSDLPMPARRYIGRLCHVGGVEPHKLDFGDSEWLSRGLWTTLEKAQYTRWLANQLELDEQVDKGEGMEAAMKFVKHAGWKIKKAETQDGKRKLAKYKFINPKSEK